MTIAFKEDGVCFDISRLHYSKQNGIIVNIIIEANNEDVLKDIAYYSLARFSMHFNDITWKHEAIYPQLKEFIIIDGSKS